MRIGSEPGSELGSLVLGRGTRCANTASGLNHKLRGCFKTPLLCLQSGGRGSRGSQAAKRSESFQKTGSYLTATSPTEERINTKVSDWWICFCGNQPDRDGFSFCDRDGSEVEPTEEEWPEPLYICNRCGRIIEQGTGIVVS